MKQSLEFKLNGKGVALRVEPDRPLLWVLRTDLNLTGTKYGCGKGQCGSCTVVIGKTARRSCMVPAGSISGKEVVTIEGLESNGKLHPIQEAFIEEDALQCGICIPGMIMNAFALLERHPEPTPDQIVRGMEGNLCRCGTYKRILSAVELAGSRMRGTRA